ncbi:uncharacterized protein LOC130390970 [Gadus chalcogrammus]|uniref:uncharacterized protein LOC130390970 n=1 Tax=Gadus chalcogrammus TaxID=1042646 RepID=UPI0024C499CB|nr:uncharacterized protein LOC130390970 [Gadus chalcogrammus]
MPGLATELRELIEGRTKSKRRHRQIIKWMQKKRLLRRWMRCQKCKHKMKFKESVCVDNYAWVCKHHNHRGRKLKRSIRHKSIFSNSKVSLFNWMRFVYRFAQGLRLRQVDMINDDISGSSATLSKMAQKLRDVCTTAMDRYQQARGQYIGGRQQFEELECSRCNEGIARSHVLAAGDKGSVLAPPRWVIGSRDGVWTGGHRCREELECSRCNEGIARSRVLAAGDKGSVLWPNSHSLDAV